MTEELPKSEGKPEEEGIQVVCAWCGKEIKKGSLEKVSHGICEDCLEKQLEEEKDNK